MGEAQSAAGLGSLAAVPTGHRFTWASPATATVLVALTLVLVGTEAALSFLARDFAVADGGAAPAALLVYVVVGVVVARHQPRNPIGWIMVVGALIAAVSQDLKLYLVLDYRRQHGTLPLGPVAASLAHLGTIVELLFPLVILLFPDGRLPSPRWRWTLWVYLAAGGLGLAGLLAGQAIAVSGQRIHVDGLGQPTNGTAGLAAVMLGVGFLLTVVCVAISLSWVARLAISYRRSAGERRQQIKWLASGAAVLVLSLVAFGISSGQVGQASRAITFLGIAALPVCTGVAILKYRLYEIDRIISRTLAYAIVTGLLIGVYAGVVLLATRVLPLSSPVAVAGATLTAAALFSPLRRRVQQVVDRRFNRARYDADQTIAAFAARLKDAVDLDSVCDDLAGVAGQVLEPAHISVWISHRG
jgi:hypothetical protein